MLLFVKCQGWGLTLKSPRSGESDMGPTLRGDGVDSDNMKLLLMHMTTHREELAYLALI